jgi:hypothetical protein
MKTLTVKEKYSRHWPAIAIASAVLAALLWGAYMLTSNVLLESYLRFAAFCFFALALLSFFKVKDGQIQIDIKVDDDGGLIMDYLVRNKQIGHDAFDLNSVESVEINKMPDRSLYNEFATGDRTIRFKRKDSDDWLYLTEVHGRVIPLDKSNAEKIYRFINSYLTEKQPE